MKQLSALLPEARPEQAGEPKSQSKILWPAFTVVTLLAFFFRFYRLADHPLGIFFDPAINGLDAIRLMQRGGPVLFFPTNGGREALFMYLLIPFIWLFGTIPFSMRALTATISLLNVVFLFAFLYQVPQFTVRRPDSPLSKYPHTPWLATLGSLALAVSYWHIAISRLGQRPILVPMLAVPVFWFFLKGWASNQKRWFVLSGLCLGLEGYTYPAARLLPVILILAVLPEFLPFVKTGRAKHNAGNLLIFLLVALVVYLPMGWYLVAHPAQFTARAFSVMVWNFLDTPAEIMAELGRNVLRVAGFFCCTGSPNPIFGLPGYPGVSPLLTPLLLVGLAGALKNWRDLFWRLVAGWWLLGLLPAIAAIEAPHPLRMIVAVVPTAILIARGSINLVNWLQLHFKAYAPRISFYVLPLALISLSLPGTFSAYFIAWARLQVTPGIYDYGAVAIRDEILRQAEEDIPIYLPMSRFNDSTLLFYLSGTFRRQAALTAPPAQKAVVISPEKNEKDTTWVRLQNQTATVLPPLTTEGQQLLQVALAGKAARPIRTVTGETVARLAPLPLDPVQFLQQPTRPVTASFGPARLTGADYNWIIDPATGELPVTLYWQANHQMSDEYESLLLLVDDQRRVWGDGSARPTGWVYPTTFWRPGLDEIAARQQVIIGSKEPPPGRYWLALSLFEPARGQRLPLTAGLSEAPDTFFIGPLKVPLTEPPPALPGQVETVPPVAFGDVATLAGFNLASSTITAGEPVDFTLLWQALTTPSLDYTVFAHLLDAHDNLVAGHDTQPVGASYPTTIWSQAERILDPHTLPTPDSLAAGQYRLAIGLYHQPSGQRLPLYRAGQRQDPRGQFILPQVITVINENKKALDHN